MSSHAASDRIVVAQFGAAHGVRGEIRLKSFTEEPLAFRSYGPLTGNDGSPFVISSARPAAGRAPDMLVVRVDGLTTREAAEALNGLELFVPRERLPKVGEDEFYHADLVGLDVGLIDGVAAGTVVAVRNFGAGDLLEIAPLRGATFLMPFTRVTVPEIDIEGGRLIIDPPPGLLDSSVDREG